MKFFKIFLHNLIYEQLSFVVNSCSFIEARSELSPYASDTLSAPINASQLNSKKEK